MYVLHVNICVRAYNKYLHTHSTTHKTVCIYIHIIFVYMYIHINIYNTYTHSDFIKCRWEKLFLYINVKRYISPFQKYISFLQKEIKPENYFWKHLRK